MSNYNLKMNSEELVELVCILNSNINYIVSAKLQFTTAFKSISDSDDYKRSVQYYDDDINRINSMIMMINARLKTNF